MNIHTPIIDARALHITVADASPFRVGKNLNCDKGGTWRKPKPDVSVPKQFAFHQISGEQGIEFRAGFS